MKKGSNEKIESKKNLKQEDNGNKKTTDKKIVEKTTEKKNKHYIADEKNVKVKKKKENIFKRISKYFKGVFKEVKRIRWTNKKDLLKYSICTVVSVLFFGLYFYAIDWIVLLVRSLAK